MKQTINLASLVLLLMAPAPPASADECLVYQEEIASFEILISSFKAQKQVSPSAYTTATESLNSAQNAALDAMLGPAAPEAIELTAAARASIEASNAVTESALKALEANKEILETLLKARIETFVVTEDPSVPNEIDEIEDVAKAAGDLSVDTFNLAGIAFVVAKQVFHKTMHAAICR